jgi:serine/threonine protein kinase/formylglycine-generating enzyme required for sulfatase activity
MFCINCFRSHNGEAICEYCQFPQDDSFRDRRALPVGSKLKGRYLIGRVLGAGGFGITYLAKDEILGRLVALKEFMPSGLVARVYGGSEIECLALEDEAPFKRGLDRFFKEGEILAKFTHPGIVGVIDLFSENNTAYLAMEFLEGMTIKDWQDAYGNFSEPDALAIMEFVTNALREVHGKHVVHRDIKPDNIYRATSGKILVLDFGGAKQIAGGGEKTQTDAHFVHGYTALEQYIGQEGNIGPWTDVYACGATLYKLLTGKVAPGALHRLTHDAPLDWSGFPVSENTRDVVARAMALKYAERIQSVSEFKTLLFSPTLIPPELPESGSEPIIEPQREPVPEPIPPLPIPGLQNWRRFVLPIVGVSVVAGAIMAIKPFNPGATRVIAEQASTAGGVAVDVAGPCAKSLQAAKFAAPKMITIPGGNYVIGSTKGTVVPPVDANTFGGKLTNVAKYEIAETETTREQWLACVADSGCRSDVVDQNKQSLTFTDSANKTLPISNVRWGDAVAYTKWLSNKTKMNFRLPTEIEWEYAARGGVDTMFFWGDVIGSDKAHCAQCNVKNLITEPVFVKKYGANQYGLFDMLGNVAEWVSDCWTESHGVVGNRFDTKCTQHVRKGGAYLSLESQVRPVYREAEDIDAVLPELGFRVACEVK